MNADRINELYYGKIFSPETQRACRDRVHWICSRVSGKRILDIGCSQGIVSLLLGREGFSCIGVDIETGAIEYAQAELAKEEEVVRRRVSFQRADAMALPFRDATFDTVIVGEVIEHLTNPWNVLGEAKRVLRKNGKCVITTPFGLNPHPDHKQTFYPLSFLRLVQRVYRTESIDVLNNYILYTGLKGEVKGKVAPPSDLDLQEYLRLQKLVEERCLLKETELFEKSKKLYGQIKQQSEEIQAIREKAQEGQSALVQQEKALALELANEMRSFETRLNQVHQDLEAGARAHEEALSAKDKASNEALEKARREYQENFRAEQAAFRDSMERLNREWGGRLETERNAHDRDREAWFKKSTR